MSPEPVVPHGGAAALAEIYLRETSVLAALRRQSSSILRHRGEDPSLSAHLKRAERRVTRLSTEIAGRDGAPPRVVVTIFRALGGGVGTFTALGGGRRTLRAIGDGARGLARRYASHLSLELPPDIRFLLACNYRDVLLLGRWIEGRLDETRPPRRSRWRGRPRIAVPSADSGHHGAAARKADGGGGGTPNAFFTDRPPSSTP